MNLEDFFSNTTTKQKKVEKKQQQQKKEPNGTIPKKTEPNGGTIANSPEEIRATLLYKGRLAYIQEILLAECPDIECEALAERLDISKETASLLLEDCRKKRE